MAERSLVMTARPSTLTFRGVCIHVSFGSETKNRFGTLVGPLDDLGELVVPEDLFTARWASTLAIFPMDYGTLELDSVAARPARRAELAKAKEMADRFRLDRIDGFGADYVRMLDLGLTAAGDVDEGVHIDAQWVGQLHPPTG